MDLQIEKWSGADYENERCHGESIYCSWFLTVLEFIFIKGMFTWLLMCSLVILTGAINILYMIKAKDWMRASLYLLTIVALCMGYISYL